ERSTMIKLNRRQFLQSAGVVGSGVTAASLLGPSRVAHAVAGPPGSQVQREPSPELAPASQSLPGVLPPGLNILFILTDQERYFDRWPIPLPGRERLKSAGVSLRTTRSRAASAHRRAR